MKQAFLILTICILMLCFSLPGNADVISINLEEATYEELVTALQKIEEERKNRLITEYSSVYTPDIASIITFRSVPFFSSKKDAETVLGLADHYNDCVIDVQIFGAVDEGIPGCSAYYSFLPLAGMQTRAYVNFIFPVIDGTLIRDMDSAVFISAVYEYSGERIVDIDAATEDLANKLCQLYGPNSKKEEDSSFARYYWTDAAGNEIILEQIKSRSTFTLAYIANPEIREQLLFMGKAALEAENAKMQEEQRIKEQNNYDGL